MNTNEVEIGDEIEVIKKLDDKHGTVLSVGQRLTVLDVEEHYIKTTDPNKPEAVCYFCEPAISSLKKHDSSHT